ETFPRRLEDNPSYLYFFGDEQNKTEYREGIFVGYHYRLRKKSGIIKKENRFPINFSEEFS
uniref:hypothetical protein n=1 Tax=Hominenteromicrobium sp. TaxID=3073581 RepID=UPI003A8EDCC9